MKEINEDMENKVKQALNDLLSNADLHKIVSFDKQRGIIYIGGEKATPEQLLNLKSEAEMLTQMNLWGLLYETPKALAERAMFIDGGELPKQLEKGRTILYTLSTQQSIIDILKAYKTGK